MRPLCQETELLGSKGPTAELLTNQELWSGVSRENMYAPQPYHINMTQPISLCVYLSVQWALLEKDTQIRLGDSRLPCLALSV